MVCRSRGSGVELVQVNEAEAHVPWQGDQDFVDRVYERLDDLRRRYRERLAEVRRQGASGTPQNRSERDAFATHYEDTLARLEQVENRLVFGRLDLEDDSRRYVGRIGIADADQESLLIDWRAQIGRAACRGGVGV